MANVLLARFVLLFSAAGSMLVLFMARHAGCNWQDALLRCALSALLCAFAGMAVLAPLARALKPVPPAPAGEGRSKPKNTAPGLGTGNGPVS